MSMEPILSEVYLDVYDHDTTPTTIKAIALDSQTRFVQAYLQKYGEVYNPDLNATVNLIALRPDKVGVEGDGEIVMLVPPGEDSEEPIYEEQEVEGEIVQVQTGTRVISGDPAIYGVKAEITQAMLAIEGVVLLQFRLTVGDEVLRTEIFKINNGKALDGSTSEWADSYDGINLEELAEKVEFAVRALDDGSQGDSTQAMLSTHLYIDRKFSIHDNGIYIDDPNYKPFAGEEWVESYFADKIKEQTDAWLDEHPEATTTVQDYSLTEKKLVKGTLGFVTPEMYGAVGDGITDDTTAIQQAVNSDAKLIIFSKKYLVIENTDLEFNPAIELASNKTYMFVGGSNIAIKPTSNEKYAIFSIINKANVTIINPSIIGDRDDHIGSTGEWGFGIFIKDSDGINIFNARIFKTWGDGIYIRSSQNIYIDYVYVEECSRIGVSFTGAKNVYIGCVEGVDINRISPKCCVDIEMDFPNETWDNIVIDSIISVGCARAFYLLPAHSSESTGNDYVVDVKINNILSDSGVVGIRSFINNSYSGSIHIGNINITNINRNTIPVSIYSSSPYIKTVIDKIIIDNCNVGDNCAVLVFNEENSNGICNLTIMNCVVTNGVAAKYSVRSSSVISDNVNIKLSAFIPVWIPHNSVLSTNKYINWKGSNIIVNVSDCVNYTTKSEEFLATTYINDKDSDTLLSIHSYFGLMGLPIKLIGKNDYVCGFYMESDITGLYPASKNFTRRDVKVSAYGEISEFILLEKNKVIITKLPTTI